VQSHRASLSNRSSHFLPYRVMCDWLPLGSRWYCFSRHRVTNIRVTRLCHFSIILVCFLTFFSQVRYLLLLQKDLQILKFFVSQWHWLIASRKTFLVVKPPITSFSCIISQCVLRVGGLLSSCCHLFEIDTQSISNRSCDDFRRRKHTRKFTLKILFVALYAFRENSGY